MKIHLLSGIFFQPSDMLYVGYDDKISAKMTTKEQLMYYLFSGMFMPTLDNQRKLEGASQDYFGEAKLFDFHLTEQQEKIVFKKQYHNSHAIIEYNLRKENGYGNIWTGTYTILNSQDVGAVKCYIQEVGEDFFDPFSKKNK